MKILYAIQGTGNGHISRAREMVPLYAKYADVDVLISGTQQEVTLDFPIKYKIHGLGFVFGKKGNIDIGSSVLQARLWPLIKNLYQLPVHQYDCIINDFECVSAWAAHLKHVPSISVSHHAAYLSPLTPRALPKDGLTEWIFRNYAPTQDKIGIHFAKYDSFIETPVIRREIRQLEPTKDGHITVYLPAYADKILIRQLTQVKDVQWNVFSKHSRSGYRVDNVHIRPINSEAYTKSLESCTGLLSGGGFEAPAEALHLGKKLLVVPMSNQYEQHCNAQAMAQLGVPVVQKIGDDFHTILEQWLSQPALLAAAYPDNAESIVLKSLDMAAHMISSALPVSNVDSKHPA